MPILKLTIGILAISAGLALLPALPVGANLWLLTIEPGYVIPEESSVFTFRPTAMNDGSGDWWIYGEDGGHYYFIGDEAGYKATSRTAAVNCEGFSASDYGTWCRTPLKN